MGQKKYGELNALVASAIQGDGRAFERLCTREAQAIIYSCIKQMGNIQDGEDAAQEVFIQLQKKLPTLKSPEAFISWLQTIIAFVCKNMRRKTMNTASHLSIDEFADFFEDPDEGVLPEEAVLVAEKRSELMKIIDKLPDQMRSCIVMHYFEEMKIAEIAKALDVTEGSVKGYLYLGREKVRKTLGKREPQRNAQTNAQTSALLPMSALGGVFREEMTQTITPEMIRRCLQTAGIHYRPAAGLAFIRGYVLPFVCTALALGITLGCAAFFEKTGVDNGPPVKESPQPLLQEMVKKPPSSTEAASVDAYMPASPPPVLLPHAAGGDDPPGETAASAPKGAESAVSSQPAQKKAAPPPAVVYTAVTGRLAVKDAAVADAANVFGNQYYATMTKDGEQLALTKVATDGSFSFDHLVLPAAGSYEIRLLRASSDSLEFAGENPDGVVQVQLIPGMNLALPEPIYIVDTEAPRVNILLMANGALTPVNPQSAEIQVSDATATTVSWMIRAANGGVLKEGKTLKIASEAFAALPRGQYTLEVTVTDAVGNVTVKSKTIYRI